MTKVFVSTIPFAAFDRKPLDLLVNSGCDVLVNPTDRKLTTAGLVDFIGNTQILIAGTEQITADALDAAPNLELVCRVGIGLDSVDLEACKSRNILVSHTPNAPSPAVAELTVGLIFDLFRGISLSTQRIRKGQWTRHFGRRLDLSVYGIIGYGRIGRLVSTKLVGLGARRENILIDDIDNAALRAAALSGFTISKKEEILKRADVVSLHLPLTELTKNMIDRDQLAMMRPEAFIVNTSRGGIINERSLFEALNEGQIKGAAVDVFECEPYEGELKNCGNIVLTAHMGSMTLDCRSQMELEACEEAARYLNGNNLLYPALV